jgi:hypothetical protein
MEKLNSTLKSLNQPLEEGLDVETQSWKTFTLTQK